MPKAKHSPAPKEGRTMPYINVYLRPEQLELLDKWVQEAGDPSVSRSSIIRNLIRERAAK